MFRWYRIETAGQLKEEVKGDHLPDIPCVLMRRIGAARALAKVVGWSWNVMMSESCQTDPGHPKSRSHRRFMSPLRLYFDTTVCGL